MKLAGELFLDFGQQLNESLLTLRLVLPCVAFGELGDVHGTEFGAAHGAELGVLVKIVGQSFVVHAPSGVGVERKLELFVPVEKETGIGESVVAVPRARAVACDVPGVGSDFVGDDSLLHVFRIRQAEMFFWRDIAKHGRAVHADHGRADGAGDVVVAGGDIGDERAERVKRRFVAELDFFFYLELDLIHRHVARAFDHYLDIMVPGFFGEFTQHAKLGKLSGVAGVGQTSRAQTIAEGKANVVVFEDAANIFKTFVEEIFFFVKIHPLGHDRAAAADDSGDALAHQRDKFGKNAGVDGHVIDALFGLLFDDFEHELWSEIFGTLDARNRFVDRHCADGNGRSFDDGFADGGDVAAGGKVHDRVGSVVDGMVEFFELGGNLTGNCGITNVRVDFALEGNADAHRFERFMMDVGGDNGAATGNFIPDKFRGELFTLRDELHLLGDDALPRIMHLRDIAIAVCAG